LYGGVGRRWDRDRNCGWGRCVTDWSDRDLLVLGGIGGGSGWEERECGGATKTISIVTKIQGAEGNDPFCSIRIRF